MKLNKRFAAPEAAIRLLFWLFAAACLLAAVCMPDRGQMLAGLKRICVLISRQIRISRQKTAVLRGHS